MSWLISWTLFSENGNVFWLTPQKVAQSWGNKDAQQQLAKMQEEFSNSVVESQTERWTINAGVHYNEWANLTKEDFKPVVEAYKKLLETFTCPKCSAFIRIAPSRGEKEGLRCDCTNVNINLKKK